MRWILTYILILTVSATLAQEERDSTNLYGIKIEGNDTVYHRNLKEIPVFPKRNFSSRWKYNRYRRLVYRLKKVYPYAKEAALLLTDYEEKFANELSHSKRRRYVKQVEKQLMERYGDELKRLTISEGRLLVRLIDRETGSTTYELVKELRGGFSAFLWQSVARIFGNNLKTKYDPEGNDQMIEEIIVLIEQGKL